MSAAQFLTASGGPGTVERMGRQPRGFKLVGVKLTPDQATALSDAAARAKLDKRPNAGDGASLVVRELVQAWIDAGAQWPGAPAPKRRVRK